MGSAVDRGDLAHPCLRTHPNSTEGRPSFQPNKSAASPHSCICGDPGCHDIVDCILHAAEAGIWAFAYTSLAALPDYRIAVLYSLNAMTSYGHTNINLPDHWHLMGALEALNGWLLFGLTTAFLFGLI